MTVNFDKDTIHLRGDCHVEDAEPLLGLLQTRAEATVDVTSAGHLHAAIVQLLLAFKPKILGPAGDAFVAQWVMPHLAGADRCGS